MAQTREYWEAWARKQGRHHYENRLPWESAQMAAECVSNDPALQAEAVKGWHEAEAGERCPCCV